MTHNKKHTRRLFSLSAVSAAALLLAACDSGQDAGETGTDTAQEEAAEPAVDYSTMISAAEIRDGIAFGEIVVGNPDAPVTMIEYASLTCQFCANFHRDSYPFILEEYIKTGRVRFVFRNYTRDRADLAVAMLSRCSGPEKVFDLMGVYFDRQPQWARPGVDPLPEIVDIARRAGISRADVDACLGNTALQNDIIEMFKQGQSDKLTGTPFFIVNGETFSGQGSIEEFTELIEDNM